MKSLVIIVLFIAIVSIGGLFWVRFSQTQLSLEQTREATIVAPVISDQQPTQPSIDQAPLPEPVRQTEHTFTVLGDMTLKVSETLVALYDKNGALVVQNQTLARLPDTSTRCPSDGFVNATSTATTFTLEQQSCSGWDTINEYMTFEHKASGTVVTEFKLEYIDTRTPLAPARVRTVTPLQFGVVSMRDATPDSLYQYLR